MKACRWLERTKRLAPSAVKSYELVVFWKVLKGAETYVQRLFPQLNTDKYPNLPEKLTFIHAEDILSRYPDLPRKQRETEILQEYPAIFIYGIGWTLEDGYPHELRAADFRVETDISFKNLKKCLKYADRSGIPFAAIIGEDERKSSKVKIKNMKTGEEKLLPLSDVGSISELLKQKEKSC